MCEHAYIFPIPIKCHLPNFLVNTVISLVFLDLFGVTLLHFIDKERRNHCLAALLYYQKKKKVLEII